MLIIIKLEFTYFSMCCDRTEKYIVSKKFKLGCPLDNKIKYGKNPKIYKTTECLSFS